METAHLTTLHERVALGEKAYARLLERTGEALRAHPKDEKTLRAIASLQDVIGSDVLALAGLANGKVEETDGMTTLAKGLALAAKRTEWEKKLETVQPKGVLKQLTGLLKYAQFVMKKCLGAARELTDDSGRAAMQMDEAVLQAGEASRSALARIAAAPRRRGVTSKQREGQAHFFKTQHPAPAIEGTEENERITADPLEQGDDVSAPSAAELEDLEEHLLTDDIGYYKRRITSRRLLTYSEEQALANRIVAERKELQRTILSNAAAIKVALSLFDAAALGASSQRVPYVIPYDQDAATLFQELKSGVLARMHSLADTLPVDPTALANLLELLERYPLRDKSVLRIAEEMELLLGHIDLPADATPEARAFAEELTEEYGVSPQTLRATVMRTRAQQALLKELTDRMILSNTRLVLSIAKIYWNKDIPFRDRMQVGNTALQRAVETFTPSTTFKFSTYATWWIRQAITRDLADHRRLIRLPVHLHALAKDVAKFQADHRQEHGRGPTVQEIADALQKTPEAVKGALQAFKRPRSLDKVITPEGEDNLYPFLEDRRIQRPEEAAYLRELREDIKQILRTLPKRERAVIIYLFALGMKEGEREDPLGPICIVDDERSYGISLILEECAAMMPSDTDPTKGLTRERVRQFKERALEKLRKPSRTKHLRGKTTRALIKLIEEQMEWERRREEWKQEKENTEDTLKEEGSEAVAHAVPSLQS